MRRFGFGLSASRRSRLRVRRWWDRRWRDVLVLVHEAWRRHGIDRLVVAVLVCWVAGSAAIHLAERGGNPDFDSWGDSFWNVWVLLFSGLENPPKTLAGRLVTMTLLVAGVGLAGLFTAGVASFLIEQYLNRNNMSNKDMENHLVLCNWSDRGLDWIREVHAKIIQEKRAVVVIHDRPEEIDLPDRREDAAFSDVYIVKGDPTSEVALRRGKVSRAHSVVVLIDDREGSHADGKTILTCVAIRSVCKGNGGPNIAVECRNPAHHHHLRKAGADEIISSTELGLRLLARTALFHGMTRVYQELLTVGRDANEMYLLSAPEALVGKGFVELSEMFTRYRADKKACVLLGVQRDEEMMLNPFGDEMGPLRATDHLILLSRVFHDPEHPLPTDPPVGPATKTTTAGQGPQS